MDRFSVKGKTSMTRALMCFPVYAKCRGPLFSPEQIPDGEECVATPLKDDDSAEMVAMIYLINKRPQYGSQFSGISLI